MKTTGWNKFPYLWILAVSLELALALHTNSWAKIFQVTNSTEFTNALIESADNGENDRIQLSSGTYAGPFTVTVEQGFALSILGDNNVILDGGNQSRVLDVYIPAATPPEDVYPTFGLTGVTVRNGRVASGSGAGLNLHCDATEATIAITNSAFENNACGGDGTSGGGLFLEGSGVFTISNNTITGNSASDGGGIAGFGNLTLVMTDNKVINNSAVSGFGGGIQIHGNAIEDTITVAISGTTISANSAGDTGGGLICFYANGTIRGNIFSANQAQHGAGMTLMKCPALDASENEIQGNAAIRDGGGLYIDECASPVTVIADNLIHDNTAGYDGGGIYYLSSDVVISRNMIWNNTCDNWGGGICVYGSSGMISNNVVAANRANQYGGGISYFFNSTGKQYFNTIVNNTAGAIGGGVYCYGSTVTIVNSIVWGNRHEETETGNMQIELSDVSDPPAQVTVEYCNVQGGWGQGVGNINADPMFVNETQGDFHLANASPCIDSGVSRQGSFIPLIDRDGMERDQHPDMGAYEYTTGGEPVNQTPVARAGSDQVVEPGNRVILNGALSSDADGTIVAYKWEQIGGSLPVTIANRDSAIAGFTAPDPGTADTVLEFRLTVTDNDQASHSDTVQVTIRARVVTIRRVPTDYETIQSAINAAENGDTILVSSGLYRGQGNVPIDTSGKAITIKSEDGAYRCIIDCQKAGPAFVFQNGETANTYIEGFTIINGSGTMGGGILCRGASPRIQNCIITQCQASTSGGALAVTDGGAPEIQNSIFRNNIAGVSGGGVYLEGEGSSLRLVNCLVVDNQAGTSDNGGHGGGVSVGPYAGVQMINCTIAGNSGSVSGGGMFIDDSANVKLLNTIIWTNTVDGISGPASAQYSDIQGESLYPGTGNIFADPAFIDDYYHIGPNSPCVDKGQTANAPQTDIDGEQRGNLVDIGADEVVESTGRAPDVPVAVEPANESWVDGTSVLLRANSFRDADGHVHTRSLWRVRRWDRGYDCPDQDCGYDASFSRDARFTDTDNPDLTRHRITGLKPGLKYAWKVGYMDASGMVSWSDESTFKVGSSIADTSVQVMPGSGYEDYKMVGFVQWPEQPEATNIFPEHVAQNYTADYRIGTYDPLQAAYIEFSDLTIEPGRAVWILARNGLDITLNGIPVATDDAIEVTLIYTDADPTGKPNGWNMISCPNNARYRWDQIQVVVYTDETHTAIAVPATKIADLPDTESPVDKRLWWWDPESADGNPNEPRTYYQWSETPIMVPYQGYWAKAFKPNTCLRFVPEARVQNSAGRDAVAARKTSGRTVFAATNEAPPAPIGGLGSTETITQDSVGGCFITTLVP